ncbi:DUF3558 domain-containing protein [Nocardia amamiensis]|uniref:DUF3558 domain-containing protein n=1 Tax=Nocardia amamiensis TaxID=404578 RepID=UPI001471E0AD|nr:DUF3558 domain-containing protein [Nocardia amamiensis]
MRAIAVAVGLCAVLAVAGCGQDLSGEPQQSTVASLSKADLYDPCTLPADAITAAGADPASKDDNPFLVARDSWKGCAWRSSWYFLDVYSTNHSVAEFKSNDIFHDFRDAQLGSRKAMTFNQRVDNAAASNCGVVFGTSRGTIQLMVRRFASEQGRPDDLCALALRSANALNGSIPS